MAVPLAAVALAYLDARVGANPLVALGIESLSVFSLS